MQVRHFVIVVATLVLIAALFVGLNQSQVLTSPAEPVAVLENVRDLAPATTPDGPQFAVDSSGLYVGQPGFWTQIPVPPEVIAGAVAVDQRPSATGTGRTETLYIGAANELAVYRSGDRGRSWLRVPLSEEFIGGVTDLALDPVQRLVYVGTDTAGLFRLRDVGSSMITGGQLRIDAPVRQVVVDPHGSGLAFARTDWDLFRAENFGLAWVLVEDLHSSPTALAMGGDPATVYVGTVDRGVVKSGDGHTWTMANEGLGLVPGSRLHVDALAVDPLQPEVLYVATSFLYGTTEIHRTPSQVAVSTDGALGWSRLDEAPAQVAELLPVGGQTGSVYALTVASRTPTPLGEAPAIAMVAEAPVVPAQNPAAGVVAWGVAGLAAVALGFALASDIRRRRVPAEEQAELESQPVRVDQG